MSQFSITVFCYLAYLALVVHGSSGLEDDLLLNIGNSNNLIDNSTTSSLVYWLWHQWKVIMKLVFKISSLPILPFLWMTGWLWRHLIVTPWTMAVHATHIMYPVLIYCGAACICGVIIGGCSGFAVEAMSSACINATFGKQHQQQQLDEDSSNKSNKDNDVDNDDVDEDTMTIYSQDTTYDDNEKMDWRRVSQHSPSSSMYRFSISSESSQPASFYDDKPSGYQGDEDPEEIASFLRQRRMYQQQQQHHHHHYHHRQQH